MTTDGNNVTDETYLLFILNNNKFNIMEFSTSQKGHETIIADGFRYTKNRVNKNGSTQWKCTKRDICTASITVKNNENIIRRTSHTCDPDQLGNDIFQTIDKIKKKACEDFGPMMKIYEESMENLSRKYREHADQIPAFITKKDSLYRARKKYLNSERLVFNNLSEVSVPSGLGKHFLIAEEGDEDKILVFVTNGAKKMMRTLKNGSYYGDGTFKTAPRPFFQVYSIHLDMYSTTESTNIIPVVYALLPDKTEITYTRLFEIIKNKLGITMDSFKCDYEKAAMNAYLKVYPHGNLSGCFFHYHKAIWRKAKEFKTSFRASGRKVARRCAILALLPPQFIPQGLAIVLRDAPKTYEVTRFLEYYQNTWYPNLSPSILSCSNQAHRTTNIVEGWNHRLNTRVEKHPTLFSFIHKIKKEAQRQDLNINKFLFGYLKKNKRKRNQIFNKKYVKALKELENGKISVQKFMTKVTFIRLSSGY